MEPLILLPPPARILPTGERFELPDKTVISLPPWLSCIRPALLSLFPEPEFDPERGFIRFYRDETIKKEGYRLLTGQEEISVYAADEAGAFYAMATLHQILLQSDGTIDCCEIQDAPGLELRGVLWDISRKKVPSLKTLKGLADLLSSLKYNHLELYMEGFSFGYPSFPDVWTPDDCLLPEEVRELSDYCRDRFIELVPHQNSLGHMSSWLALPQFKKLAESEEGLQVSGMNFPPTTLDAADPESLLLVRRLTEDLLPSFHTEWFHAGLDEPFELGKGKNAAFVRDKGAGALALPYIRSLYDMLKGRGRHMMMWDDLVCAHPDMLNGLPEDILILDWGYDGEYPVEKRASRLREAGRAFCVCPGTSSWSSFTGLTDNMLTNISRAGKAAYANGARGMIVTDWGDMNHLQYQPVSYPGIAFGAAYAWNPEGIGEKELEKALDVLIFQDESGQMGQLSLKAGRFYRQEEFRMPCRSLSCLPLLFGRLPESEFRRRTGKLAESVSFFSPPEVCGPYLESYQNRKKPDFHGMLDYLRECNRQLDRAALSAPDGKLILREYRNALRMLSYLTQVRAGILTGNRLPDEMEQQELIREHCSLWTARNKRSGLMDGVKMFERLK